MVEAHAGGGRPRGRATCPWRTTVPGTRSCTPASRRSSRCTGVGEIGVLGQLRPDVAAALRPRRARGVRGGLSAELRPGGARARPFADLGTYPPASQDLAVVVGRDVPAAEVVELARRAGGKLVRSVRVFDVYEGDQVPGGQALAGPARGHGLAGAHAEREGHRRRARQDPQGARAGVPGRPAVVRSRSLTVMGVRPRWYFRW